MKNYYPIFLDLEGRPCLVVGAGKVARRKVESLLACGATVTVVAPGEGDACADLPVRREVREFEERDLGEKALVIAATSDSAVNDRISQSCKVRNIPVNVVDDPDRCTFIVPALARRGRLTLAVSSGGSCPVAAQIARDRAASALDDDFLAKVDECAARRDEIASLIKDPNKRRSWYEDHLSSTPAISDGNDVLKHRPFF